MEQRTSLGHSMTSADGNNPTWFDSALTAATVIFFCAIAVLYTFPIGEGDYFWHVKTGEWIWQHRSLPSADHFSYTVKGINPFDPDSLRIPFILKQYWLGQLFMYANWLIAGEAGMVALRAVIYTGILGFIYWWLRRTRKDIVPFAAVFIVGNVLRNYANERPQIFAFLIMPLLLYLLETTRTRSEKLPSWLMGCLPLLMLAWCNIHGSFILGIALVVIYLANALFEKYASKKQVAPRTIATFFISILITMVNPNGLRAFSEFFSLSKGYTNTVAEYASPIFLAREHGVMDYGYWFFAASVVILLLTSFRRMPLAHQLLLAALLYLSLTGVRYIPFLLLAAPIAASYVPEFRTHRWLLCIPLIVTIAWLASADYRNILKFRAEKAFPQGAVRFLNSTKPGGNMFNYITWGGYLMCNTNYQVFIDGRALVKELVPFHEQILAGYDWENIADKFAVNFIIIPGTNPISSSAFPLLLQMRTNERWILVYQDDVALIFIRNQPQNQQIILKYQMDKSRISSHIKARWEWQLKSDY